MSNYCAASRTNYFQVKDEPSFRAWAGKFQLKVLEKNGLFCVLPSQGEDGAFSLFSKEGDDMDICDEIAAHLAEGSVAVVVESGHEKLRYVSGWAIAINHKGERAQICLDDVYELAKAKFGVEPSRAAY